MDGIASVILFAVGGLLGGVAGFVIARALRGGDLVPRHDLEQIRAEKQALEARLEERAEKYKADIQARQDEIRALQGAREQSIALQAEKESLEKRMADHKTDLETMQAKLALSFESLSNRIFEDKAVKFKQQSRESLSELLNPLRDRLADFHKKVEDSFGEQTKEQFALKKEIERIVETHKNMTTTTEALTKALRGDSKVQGNWGEVVLENILKDSGLRRNNDYILQGADLGLKHTESGQSQKPDVVVKLPDGTHIIIDSKVSLLHYERYSMEEEPGPRQIHLKQFLASVRAHVGELHERRYQNTDKLDSPDMVLMFMPIEGAFALALQEDPELQDFAWNRQIVLVCPSTLFACMRTIHSLWRMDSRNRNADEIARLSGELYDKISGFVKDMEKLGEQIKRTDKTFDDAMNKLSRGNGNVLRRIEKIRTLGARATKELPRNLLDDPSESPDDDQTGNAGNVVKMVENE